MNAREETLSQPSGVLSHELTTPYQADSGPGVGQLHLFTGELDP